MALILNIETATTVCSVSVAQDGKLLAFKEQDGDYSHAENLTVFIQEVIKEANIKLSQLDAIAVSKGPGSYTGLRIGVSTAKGLCYSLEKPLIAVNTLEHLSTSISPKQGELICPMIDARRMEVYCAVYDINYNCIMPTCAKIIDEASFAEFLSPLESDRERRIIFIGDGAAKCKDVLSKNSNAIFVDNVFPSAKNMVTLTEQAFSKKQFEDLAYFEPFYLKDFVAGKKKESNIDK